MKSRVRGAASKPLQTSRSTPQSRVVTPMEALSFGEKAAEVNVALSLARRQLGEYEFYAKNHALLGTGSYGSVFVARTRDTRTNVAIKLLGWREYEPVKLVDVLRECSLMTELAAHPAIVRFRGVHALRPGTYAIVLEHVAGGELWAHCSKHAPLPELEARHFFGQLLDVLVFMHERRIAHRDVKLENIMLEKSASTRGSWPNIKVIDFGLSQRLTPAASSDAAALARCGYNDAYPSVQEEVAAAALLAQLKPPAQSSFALLSAIARAIRPVPCFDTSLGSIFYLSPEATKVRARLVGYGLPSDIWSAGVCAFVMLSQAYPFMASTDEELMQLLSRGPELRMDGKAWATVSPQARDLVARMLSPAPEDRPTAAQALRHAWFASASPASEALREHTLVDVAVAASPAGAESTTDCTPPESSTDSMPPEPSSACLPCVCRSASRVTPLLPAQTQADSPGAFPYDDDKRGACTFMSRTLLRSLQLLRVARNSSRRSLSAESIAAAPAEASPEPPQAPQSWRRLSNPFACLAPDVAKEMPPDDSAC